LVGHGGKRRLALSKGRVGGEDSRPRQAASGGTRRPLGGFAGHALGAQLLGDDRLLQCRKLHDDATGCNGLEGRQQLFAEQDEDEAIIGFFERLQQSCGGHVAHQVHLVHDHHPHVGFGRGEHGGLHDCLGFFVVDCRTFAHDFRHVDEAATHHEVCRARGCVIRTAHQTGGKGTCCHLLAGTFWSDEEVGVGRALGQRSQPCDRGILPDDGVPNAGHAGHCRVVTVRDAP